MIRTSDGLEAISAAWVVAAGQLPNVPKETTGQVGSAQRKYADLATVTETVRPILAANGLAYLQGVSDGDKIVTVTTRLVHKSGEWIEDSMSMPTGKGDAQAVGSAVTYGRRYALMALLGLAPDDDDGAAASRQAPAARRATPPANVNADTGEIDPNKASEAQVKKVVILMRERLQIPAGLTNEQVRAWRLAWLSEFIRRTVTTTNDLTPAEAHRIIDHLEQQVRT